MELKNQPKLYSTETGEVIKADPAKIAELVSSGKAAFKRGEIIPVVDANGSVSGVPAEDFTNALSQGFQYEPLESQQKRAQEQEYGDQPIRAGVEGAARGLTLGLSDVALRGMGADAEGLAARKEFNPITSTLTEVGGAVAPILFTGGGGAAVKGGTMAAKAAAMTPAALAARAGTSAMRATEAAIGSGAAKSLAGKIAKSAIPMAAGSAVEGAIYSAGNVLSEAALGDPDINAEKAIAQIGMGAALGGALGGLVGTVAAPFGKKTAHIVSELDDEVRGVNQATGMAVNSPALNEAERKAFNSGITGVAPDAKDIKRAGEVFGVEVFPEQVTSNSAKKSASAILDNSVSPTAIARNNMKQDSIRKVVDGIEQTVGSGLEMTEIQAGKQMVDQVKAKFDAAYEPSQRLYKIVDQNIPHIEVADKAKTAIIANLKKMDGYNIKGSLEKKAADFVIDNLPNMKTAKDIKNLAESLKSSGLINLMEPKQRRIATMVTEKLDNLVEASTVRAGEKLMAETGDATLKTQIQEVLRAIPESKKAYAVFRDKLDTFAAQLGRKKISGKAAFEEFLEDLAPHKLMSRMFDKKDDAFLKFLVKEFPEEANLLFQHKKTQILEAARKAESVTPIFREVEKMAPEVRALVFRPDELEKLNLGEKYLKTISYSRNPSFGNPSRTAYTESAIDAFSSPRAALTGWARDATIKKFIETGAGFDGAMVSALKSIEGAAQKVTKELSSTVKTFLTKAAPVGTYLGVKAFVPKKQEERGNKQKEFEKQQKEVTNAISNPEAMADKISASFSGLGKFAPKMAEAATYKATMAVSFLYEKMPKNPMAQENIFSNKQWKPSDFEVSKWMKYVNTVEDPMSAFKDLKKGRMSMEQAETLKTIYPQLYGEATRMFMEELPKLKEELPYQKRVQLGVLFDLPTDPSLKPEFVAQMQLSHAQATQQEAQKQQSQNGVSASRADKLNFSEKAMTNTQRVMTRS